MSSTTRCGGISGTGYETPKRQRLSDWVLSSLSLKLLETHRTQRAGLASLRKRELPFQLFGTPAFRLVAILPVRQPDALWKVFLFKFKSDGIVPGIGHISQPAGHAKREKNGGIPA
jgi:hypothetical protein